MVEKFEKKKRRETIRCLFSILVTATWPYTKQARTVHARGTWTFWTACSRCEC